MYKNKKRPIKGKNIAIERNQISLILKLSVIVSFLVIGSFMACNSDSRENIPGDLSKQFALLPASYTGIDFENFVEETEDRSLNFYEYFYAGSGVAVGDVNNDDLPDVFFTGK